ncbi:ATP-dependent DNA ligase [Teratosphaeria nubilosa]|uniref:DNA ligase n=1 Tax=Teratosphaeria nubilosa TaxID=161662 RepID=A0A6G1LND6_9PEZI|nr:ATP-dependent DNA ligase [Teratosphaeria nubilosa]
MYGHGAMTEEELNEKYPNRPHNFGKTLPFHDLYLTLFNPLGDNKKKPTGPVISRKNQGPHGSATSPNEIRRQIIERFISRWRNEVGNDIYPAFRLIVPEKDRDRGMYGLKEATIAKLLIQVMKINKDSEDGYNLLHWKLPGVKASSAMAGDFARRCFEVISKRPMRSMPGNMTIAEVNELLDRLSVAQKEENQRPIIEEFYKNMNAEEMMWLIRIILRQMKVGATEKTFFEIWHPDAENLFNISSNLRRVCWELTNREIRLEDDNKGIHLMQCFQPQLAAFQMKTMEQMVSRMKPTEEDPFFWIEEKLDGERMQLHMDEDDEVPGGKRFGFWSRKAKDYTYLYGNGFRDENAALTQHLSDAFDDGVRNIVLDGEMITWDMDTDAVVSFGTLKTAALAEQKDPYRGTGQRPVFKVFDCLHLNGVDLIRYNLRKRREALQKSVKPVARRLEIHEYQEAKNASEVETMLRQVIATGGEGLVLKNPRSEYRLNDRDDDWVKVKPEYMTEFGEALDCIVVGGYYGSGKRGGGLSSFLCGLRLEDHVIKREGWNPQKCYSFFKVGGGFTAADYAEIRHRTEGKWMDWDPKTASEYIHLGGWAPNKAFEKPDVWIKPEDSVVVSVKAAQVTETTQFSFPKTLRFPRFQKLRTDKDWKSALSTDEFKHLETRAKDEKEEKQFKIDDARRKRNSKRRKREMVIQGQEQHVTTPYAGPATKVFEGLSFLIMTEAQRPLEKTKAEIEQLVKANGGTVVASAKDPNAIIIADRRLVPVASLEKKGERNIVRPCWLYDCVQQSELDIGRPSMLLPFDPRHMYFTTAEDHGKYDNNVDEYGDSYVRDVTADDLLKLFKDMPATAEEGLNDAQEILDQLQHDHGQGMNELPGFMFHGLNIYLDGSGGESMRELRRLLEFGCARIAGGLEDDNVTHVVVGTKERDHRLAGVRETLSRSRRRQPRIVSGGWVADSWNEGTLLDEERHSVR